MKFIITEQQSNKFKNFILSKIREGVTPYDLQKWTGIPLEIIADVIMDEEIKYNFEDKCVDFEHLLYHFLRPAKKLYKENTYKDGSEIELYYDSMGDTSSYEYVDNMNNHLFGYATLFYEGGCGIPVDVEEYDLGGKGWRGKHLYKWINMEDRIMNIRTYRDLVQFYNRTYLHLLKKQLDEFIKKITDV
jgi:hypothetical protein